ncbi:unnamed protein product [Vitrella brassicaformis CCMP3155]|uniref:Methyltransferase domain-containing protein n=2 Tax=Vitrella brassicaformis TaxID=1169539 RepID=A0A0G4EMY8_VITBC|nr:unnamed protein product [Vitrella brassicaformis CCMP3155]|eukprot:CEL98382.1 unnamed protein product [Vitrella brassicaformis CCMP3155]
MDLATLLFLLLLVRLSCLAVWSHTLSRSSLPPENGAPFTLSSRRGRPAAFAARPLPSLLSSASRPRSPSSRASKTSLRVVAEPPVGPKKREAEMEQEMQELDAIVRQVEDDVTIAGGELLAPEDREDTSSSSSRPLYPTPPGGLGVSRPASAATDDVVDGDDGLSWERREMQRARQKCSRKWVKDRVTRARQNYLRNLRKTWPRNFLIQGILRAIRDHMKVASTSRGVNWEQSNYLTWLNWDDKVRAARDPRTEIPKYFEAPIHGILEGNLCITQAVEQSAAMKATMTLFQGTACYRSEALEETGTEIELGVGHQFQPLHSHEHHHDSAFFVREAEATLGRNAFPRANLLPTVDKPRVLDIGCGTGDSTALLQTKYQGAAVEGVDLSPHMIAVARYRYPHMEFHHAAGERTFFDNDTFDMVTMFAVSHELPKGVTFKILQEGLRILKPGGRFVLVDQDPESPIIRRQLALPEITTYIEPYLKDWCTVDLHRYFSKAGYQVMKKIQKGVFVTVVAKKPDSSSGGETPKDHLMRGDVGSMINAGIEAVGKMLNNPLKALQDAGIDLPPPSFSPPSQPVSSLATPLASQDQQGQQEELSVVAPPPPPMSVAMRKGNTAKLVTPKPPYKDPFLHRFEDETDSHRSSSRQAAADSRAERARPHQQQQEGDTRRPPSPSRPQAEQRLDEAASGEQTAVERAESNPSVTSEDRNLPKGVWGFF